MKAINPNIFPHDGFWFKEADGSKHVGQTWAGVIARVAAYRQRQGKPIDHVAEEVIAQACARTPNICTEESAAVKEMTRYASLKGRVLLWLSKMRELKSKIPFIFVNEGMHAARSDVCIRCSKNTGMPEGCGSCRAAVKALLVDIVGSKTSDSRLGGCAVLGEYLPASTWIDEVTVANPALPGECWRRRSL
jgi:hypothetical protein